MLDRFTRGEAFLSPMVIVGGLLIVILLILFFVRKRKGSSELLEGGFIYDIGRSLLERPIPFDPVKEMEFSIGPEPLSDNHIRMDKGSSFKFTVSAEQSISGDKYITIRCEPPGLLIHRDTINTSVNLYSGEEFMMNDIPIMYTDNRE